MAGTITHSWNGTILTITSDSGTSSCDLKGDKGDMGIRGCQGEPGIGIQGAKGEPGTNTPIKGVDYWTTEDKAEITAGAVVAVEEELNGALNAIIELQEGLLGGSE